MLASVDGARARLLRIGLQDEYSNQVGDQKYLRRLYGMDSQSIFEKVYSHLCNMKNIAF